MFQGHSWQRLRPGIVKDALPSQPTGGHDARPEGYYSTPDNVRTPFQRFEDLTRRVLNTPKAELTGQGHAHIPRKSTRGRKEVTKLDYDAPSIPPRNHLQYAIVGCFIGFVVTIPAIALAALSGGGGHGHYSFARAVFPLEMLGTRLTGDHVTVPLMTAACAQFPIYGLTIAYCWSRRNVLWPILLGAVHLIAAIGCFCGLIPNFS